MAERNKKMEKSIESREVIVEQLKEVLLWLDSAGEALAAIHINQAIEMLLVPEIRLQFN